MAIKLRSILTIMRLNFVSSSRMVRVSMFFFALCLFLNTYISQVERICETFNLQTTPLLYSIIMANDIPALLVFLSAILMYCDAPFICKGSLYHISRSGKAVWYIGQILYVFIFSILYIAAINIFIFIKTVPVSSISGDWGNVIYSLAETDLGITNNIALNAPYSLLLQYGPISAIRHAFCLSVLITCLLGFLFLVFNLAEKNLLGMVLISTIVLLPFVAKNTFAVKLLYIAPTSWVNLAMMSPDKNHLTPSLNYAYTLLIFANVISIICGYIIQNKSDANRILNH